EIGIQPDILVCRTERPLSREIKEKIALFCNVDPGAVITAIDVDTIYEVPLNLHREGLDDIIVKMLGLSTRPPELSLWEETVRKVKDPSLEVRIAIVGKYVELKDSYKSLIEALTHGGIGNDARVEPIWVDSEEIERRGPAPLISGAHGILIPGGFGQRGIEGKVAAVKYAREKKVPYFGICLGMQCAVIEFARNVCGLEGANSTEFDSQTPHPVLALLQGKGGTMRLGASPCLLKEGSLAQRVYGESRVLERHRHRYEVNNSYRASLEEKGLLVSGISPDGSLVEVVEIPSHPYFLGCQYHPEFRSSPRRPHPLFRGFVAAAITASGELFT
ncbi:MAG: CTP synthase, partial [Nitrospinota bacterium]